MESALAWIGQIAEWIGRFFPRWLIVPTTHAGVKFVHGSKVVKFGAGIHWYWPLVTEVQMYPIARQAVDLRTQTLVTTDGKVVALGGLVVYKVNDVEPLIARTYMPDQTVKDICAGVIHDVATTCTWEDLQQAEFTKELKLHMQKRLKPYGVGVIRTTLTDLAPCRVYKLVQSTSADVG